MQSADVVDLIDKAWKVGGDIFERLVIHQIDGLDLKRLHKALGLGIVVGIAAPAHGADKTMFGEYVAVGLLERRHGGTRRPFADIRQHGSAPLLSLTPLKTDIPPALVLKRHTR